MCPQCAVPLTVVEKHGIEIDYCEKCHGVWLQKGELEKVIEQTSTQGSRNDNSSTLGDAVDSVTSGSEDGGNVLADLFDFLGNADV